MKYIYTLTCLLIIVFQSNAQSFPFTEIGFELNGDSILHLAAADLEGEDGQEIFLTVSGSNGIFYLTPKSQGSSDFNLQRLNEVESPIRVFGAHLNSAGYPDLLYSTSGKAGMGTLHGEDENNTPGTKGTKFENDGLSAPHDFTSLPYISSNSSRFINTHFFQLDAKTLSIWTSTSSSFNIIAPSFNEDIIYDFDIAAISSINTKDNVGHLYLIDGQTGDLHKQVLNYTDPFNYSLETSTIVVGQVPGAIACKTLELENRDQYLFVLTNDELIRYDINNNYESSSIAIEMDNPSDLDFGNFDNNDSLDIVIQDGQNIWLLANGVGRNNQELIITTELLVKELETIDINHDGLSDIVYTMRNSPNLSIVRNDKLTSVENVQDDLISDIVYPNPTNGYLYVKNDWKIVNILNINGEEINKSYIESNVVNLRAGVYFFRLQKEGKITTQKIVVL